MHDIDGGSGGVGGIIGQGSSSQLLNGLHPTTVIPSRTSVQKSMFCGLSSKYRCGIIKVDPRFVAWF